ncbi:hypothetical protein [Paracoccus sp. ME4]|uniref:hypothetical protein n=1 Tax=Paracoccus sp. ME4 TaxID=3138066 RepID=UPI00398AE7B8
MAHTSLSNSRKATHGKPADWQSLPEVTAHAYSDDRRIEVTIDARPWLLAATPEILRRMDAIEWGGDYEADEIFHHAERAGCSEARRLADYLGTNPTMPNGDTVGFEVNMDPAEAYAWLEEHRPGLEAAIDAGTVHEPAKEGLAPFHGAPAGRSDIVLTRKMVAAIAKAFAGQGSLSYLQRIDVIAEAIGFQNQATLMSVLGEAEKRAAAPAGGPAAMPAGGERSAVIVAFGQGLSSMIADGELLGSGYDGDISERRFETPAEAAAYIQGLEDMDGWMEFGFAAVQNVPRYNHNEAFFAARADDPSLTFEQFHDASVERQRLDDEGEDDLEP